MAIGDGWAEGAFVDAGWASSAWQTGIIVFTVIAERVQAIAVSLRTHIIGL